MMSLLNKPYTNKKRLFKTRNYKINYEILVEFLLRVFKIDDVSTLHERQNAIKVL